MSRENYPYIYVLRDMRWWWTCLWDQMNLQDFTSVWDLLELLFAEILQFVS